MANLCGVLSYGYLSPSLEFLLELYRIIIVKIPNVYEQNVTLVSFRAVGMSENPRDLGSGHYITRIWLGDSSNVVGMILDWNRINLSAILRGAPNPRFRRS